MSTHIDYCIARQYKYCAILNIHQGRKGKRNKQKYVWFCKIHFFLVNLQLTMKINLHEIVLGAVLMLSCLFCGCSNLQQEPVRDIVVFHSYDDQGEEGEPFRETMAHAFEEQDMTVNIHHIYLDLIHKTEKQVNTEVIPAVLDSIGQNWKPEVLLLNDDLAYRFALNHNQDSLFLKYPVVFSGVNVLLPDLMARHPNFTGFEDRIDLKENCRLAQSFYGDSLLHIDLDRRPKNLHDYMLYRQFQKTDEPQNHISYISSRENLNLLANANSWTLLNVKHDILSNTFIDQNGKPDFTAIREGFNNPEQIRFVGGYFTSMQTQVQDQVDYAVMLMKGSLPSELPLREHDKGYYMDYHALEKMPDSTVLYQANKNNYQTENVPFGTTNPIFYAFLLTICIVFALALGFGLLLLGYMLHKVRRGRLKQEREEQTQLRTQLLNNTYTSTWRIANDNVEIPFDFANKYGLPQKMDLGLVKDMIHPNSLNTWEEILNFRQDFGTQKKRLCLSFDQKENWLWFDAIYNITPESVAKGQLEGLLISANEQVAHEEKMKQALALARETDQKERFLRNISNELLEPAQQMYSSVSRLTNLDLKLSKEEQQFLAQRINASIKTLLDDIDLVVRHTSKCVLLPLCLGLASLLGSCQQEKPVVKVLLLHQYDNKLTGYKEFHEALQEQFGEEGYTLELRNIYLDLSDPNRKAENIFKLLPDPALLDWNPDLIMAEGDRSMPYAFDLFNGSEAIYSPDIPVVFGGITNPQWETLGKYPNITTIADTPDLIKNIELAQEFSNHDNVMIELDYNPEDMVQRRKLRQELGRMFQSQSKKETMQVLVLSVERPELNSRRKINREQGLDTLVRYYTQADQYAQLVIKKDPYSEVLAAKSSEPAFTSCRELFADGRGRYLAGYFADYATVGSDMAETAVNLLHGQKNLAATRSHTKHYYLDYTALQSQSNHLAYRSNYIIKNLPDGSGDSMLELGKSYLLGLTLLLGLLALYHFTKTRRNLKHLKNIQEDNRTMSKLVVENIHSHYVANMQEMKDLTARIDPAYPEQREKILETLDKPGIYLFSIHAALRSDQQQEWWRLRYAIVQQKNGRKLLEGMLLNIDDIMKYESELKQAEALEQEALEKEKFLWKISHEIRTPLNAVYGFANMLVDMGEELEPEEKRQMCLDIQRSTDAAYKIINDIMQYADILNENSPNNVEKIEVGTFIRNMTKRHEPWFNRHNLHIIMIEGRDGIFINADPDKLTGAFRQLIDNARKFTSHASIVLGWEYNMRRKEVDIFVEDSGQGIAEDKLPALFNMFWKGDSFVPGIGIGLNIAESYVRHMNAKLKVETEEGVGSRFTITIPVVAL